LLPTGPAIYGWFVNDIPVYVGEAENLKRRIQYYTTPGPSQQTNQRMKEYFQERQAQGNVVSLAVLRGIRLNGQRIGPGTLTDKFLRRLIEAICIRVFSESGYELQNR